jgi:hypothetical protein
MNDPVEDCPSFLWWAIRKISTAYLSRFGHSIACLVGLSAIYRLHHLTASANDVIP